MIALEFDQVTTYSSVRFVTSFPSFVRLLMHSVPRQLNVVRQQELQTEMINEATFLLDSTFCLLSGHQPVLALQSRQQGLLRVFDRIRRYFKGEL